MEKVVERSWHNLRYFLGSCQVRLRRISPQLQSYLFLSTFAKLRQAAVSIVMSVCLSVCPSVRPPAWNSSAPTGRILNKFDM
jgi:hypothetical protein